VAETLGNKLDRVQNAIAKLESGAVESYEIEGRKVTYASLNVLYKRESELIKQIELYGRDYIPGSNTNPQRRIALVSFS